VPAGIIGARIYHVITDPQLFEGQWYRVVYIWEGGLGIWGGIALGVAVGLWVARRRGIPLLPLLDVVAPALALAQAIGRWGNYWNQELFGRPTTLPWGLEIDVANRPAGYEQYSTFHPTFLYESLWNLALCGVLLLIDRRHRLRPGRLFVVYVGGYTFARFFIERLRIDTANKIFGLRVNEWVSALMFLGAVGFLAVDAWRHRGDEPPVAEPGSPDESDGVEVADEAGATSDETVAPEERVGADPADAGVADAGIADSAVEPTGEPDAGAEPGTAVVADQPDDADTVIGP
jgi:prolipoprotein diacylglyceryl transferase